MFIFGLSAAVAVAVLCAIVYDCRSYDGGLLDTRGEDAFRVMREPDMRGKQALDMLAFELRHSKKHNLLELETAVSSSSLSVSRLNGQTLVFHANPATGRLTFGEAEIASFEQMAETIRANEA